MFSLSNFRLLALAGFAVGALAIGSAGTSKFYEWQIMQGRIADAVEQAIKVANDQCTYVASIAEHAAVERALVRHQKASDDALGAARAEYLQNQLERVAQAERSEKDIEKYKAEGDLLDRQCHLDQRRFELLYGEAVETG